MSKQWDELTTDHERIEWLHNAIRVLQMQAGEHVREEGRLNDRIVKLEEALKAK